jgi:hypothetical protein
MPAPYFPKIAGPFRRLRALKPAYLDLAVDTQTGTGTGSGSVGYVTIQPLSSSATATGQGTQGTPQSATLTTAGTATGSGLSAGAGEGIPCVVGLATASGTASTVSTVITFQPVRVLGAVAMDTIPHVVHTGTGVAIASGTRAFVERLGLQRVRPPPLRTGGRATGVFLTHEPIAPPQPTLPATPVSATSDRPITDVRGVVLTDDEELVIALLSS